MASSPSAEMRAAQDAVAIYAVERHDDHNDVGGGDVGGGVGYQRAVSFSTGDDADAPVDDVRHASPTAAATREPPRLLSPRLIRALRQLMQEPQPWDPTDDSLAHDSDLEAALGGGDDATTGSATGDSASQPIVLCQICLDDVALDETMELSACGHRFCAACFTRFLTLKITEGQVHLTCFYELPVAPTTTSDLAASAAASSLNVCGATIARGDIERLVPPKVVAKFDKFRFNQTHSFARQCPFCDGSVLCEGPEQPQCVCALCERAFCFTHGSAHDAGVTCAQYDKRQLRAEKRNRRKIRRISKPCPTCQSPVEKNGGCNHMRCLHCSTDFCWLCGQKVSELISDHYDWTNIRGCAGQQMVHIHGLTTTNKCLLYLARLALYVIVYPIALALTLLAMLLSCFFALCLISQELTFVQVFRWAFRVIAIAGYTAIEFLAVTMVTGLAAAVFGVCWAGHELYKLGKRSMQQCAALRLCSVRTWCRLRWCSRPCTTRAKAAPPVEAAVATSPHVLECAYARAGEP